MRTSATWRPGNSAGDGRAPDFHKEPLVFENVHLTQKELQVSKSISLTLKIWRQSGPEGQGRFDTYPAKDISTDMSFLEMLDVVNEKLALEGQEPVAFDHDCREGICGSCGNDGQRPGSRLPKGHHPVPAAHAAFRRRRHPGHRAVSRPAFPVIKDLVVDRSAFDRIIQASGYISVNTGSAPEANSLPVPPADAEKAMDAAPASAAAPVSPPARTLRRCSLSAPRCPSSRCCPRPSGSRTPVPRHGAGHGWVRIRQLFQSPRVRENLPEGDFHRQHRTPEPRVLQGKLHFPES